MKPLKALHKYFYKYRGRLLWGAVFVVISNIFGVIPAQLVRHAFDLVKETIDLYFLFGGLQSQQIVYDMFAANALLYGGLIVLMALLRGIFLFFMRQTIIVMSRHIEFDQKNEIYRKYQSLPLSFYRRNNTGDLMARISEDVSQVRMYTGPALMYSINLFVLIVLVVGYMLSVNVRLTLYVLLPLPILSISIYYVSNTMNRYSKRIQESLSEISTFAQEAFSGIRVIKAYARQQDSAAHFERASKTYRGHSLKLANVDALFYPIIMALIGAANIITIYIGGIEVMRGNITTGNIAEFVIYINMLTWPVTSVGWVTSIVQRASASQQRINEFLDVADTIQSDKNIETPIEGHIRFKEVSLVYPDTGIKALDKVSFEISPGQTLAILGNTGSGKSTVANLVCRLYEATEGTIFIDNEPIQDYNPATLRQQIGYVPQDVFLFSESIRNNIAFGFKEAAAVPEDKIITASKEADLHQNIQNFMAGYDTVLGERGITLSGGQKQRLSIARALILEPSILIMDDALSAVDTYTENTILANLRRVMANRTAIIISHRVSSARLADKIIVLDDGQVVQSGTHDELIDQKGPYKELYDKQLTDQPQNQSDKKAELEV